MGTETESTLGADLDDDTTPSPPSMEDLTSWNPWSSTRVSAPLPKLDTTPPEVPSLKRPRTRRRELSFSTSTTKSDSNPEILANWHGLFGARGFSFIQKGFPLKIQYLFYLIS